MDITANIAGRGLAKIGIHEGRIRSIRVLGECDFAMPWVGPGFVDLQLNGFAGVNFSDANLDPKTAISILPAVWKTGVTTFCPTLITNSIERLQQNFQVLEAARKLDTGFAESVPGYHLEGPYLSSGGSRGCHDPRLMHPPDWDEFMSLQKAAGENIVIVTLAPELPNACEFIRRASAAGIIVAIGHSDATPEQIHRAVEAGASLSTHLGNGCPELIHRHQNPIWSQLASDQLTACLICDSFHLPPDFVRTVLRAKGIERCILVTDAVHVAELPPGKYSLVDREIELRPSGQVVTCDGHSMAGSALSMNRAVAVFSDFSGANLTDAIQAASTNPGRVLRREGVCIDLAADQPANLVVFRTDPNALRIEGVLLQGRQVFASNGWHLPS